MFPQPASPEVLSPLCTVDLCSAFIHDINRCCIFTLSCALIFPPSLPNIAHRRYFLNTASKKVKNEPYLLWDKTAQRPLNEENKSGYCPFPIPLGARASLMLCMTGAPLNLSLHSAECRADTTAKGDIRNWGCRATYGTKSLHIQVIWCGTVLNNLSKRGDPW